MGVNARRPVWSKLGALRAVFTRAKPLAMMVYVAVLAFVIVHAAVDGFFTMGRPRAWDGSGHYGVAQIYDQNIFPDTFGWIDAYFGGMPFPNFYPPLFFWCAAFLHHSHLLSLDSAFKLLILAPVLLMPALIWGLAWGLSHKNYSVAFWAAFLSLLPLIDPRFGGHFFWASGLDYFSTFAIGMYTQPLGFALLILWYITYRCAHRQVWRFTLASVLLALAVLANYLNGLTSILFIAATLAADILKYQRGGARRSEKKLEARRSLVAHAVSPFVSAGLALFWLMPMLNSYHYFTTRPFTLVVFTGSMFVWYALAVCGFFCWRCSGETMWPYAAVCFGLANMLTFAAVVSPRWYPLQANRLSPTLNFFLAVPVGFCVATFISWLKTFFFRVAPRLRAPAHRLKPYAMGVALALLMGVGYGISQSWEMKVLAREIKTLSFYPPPGEVQALAGRWQRAGSSTRPDVSIVRDKSPAAVTREEVLNQYDKEHAEDEYVVAAAAADIEQLLGFAREHREGRYLVELRDVYDAGTGGYDSRALNSYLGAQGNETLIDVFREASPNSIFMYPQVNALSFNQDNFGISSVLADDLDFAEQPLARHLERVKHLGGRYLIIHSPAMKERLAVEPGIGARYDFGAWSVFKMEGDPAPRVRPLPYRPALLVTEFTLKGRRSGEYNYLRFAEEQFADGWFDVLLVHSPGASLDELGSLNDLYRFGAIILDTYDCFRCEYVYRQLNDFAQNRPLILLMKDDPLFNRLKASIGDFPFASIIERGPADPGTWLDNESPRNRYNSSAIRQQWAQIRTILERHKVATEPISVSGESRRGEITIRPEGGTLSTPKWAIPILINTTFHPNWRSQNGSAIYVANPMFMLTFVDQPTSLRFARQQVDSLALLASSILLAVLLIFTGWHYARRQIGARGRAVARDGRSNRETSVRDSDISEETHASPSETKGEKTFR